MLLRSPKSPQTQKQFPLQKSTNVTRNQQIGKELVSTEPRLTLTLQALDNTLQQKSIIYIKSQHFILTGSKCVTEQAAVSARMWRGLRGVSKRVAPHASCHRCDVWDANNSKLKLGFQDLKKREVGERRFGGEGGNEWSPIMNLVGDWGSNDTSEISNRVFYWGLNRWKQMRWHLLVLFSDEEKKLWYEWGKFEAFSSGF